MKAAQTAKHNGLTIYQALSTETGHKVLRATFDWLRARGVEEALLEKTIEFLARAGDDVHEIPLALEIIDSLETVQRHCRDRRENRPHLVVSNEPAEPKRKRSS